MNAPTLHSQIEITEWELVEDWGVKFGSVEVTGSELREDYSTGSHLPLGMAALHQQDHLGSQDVHPEVLGVSGSK